MNTITHYTVEPRYAEGPEVTFENLAQLREHMESLAHNADLYTVRTHYTNGSDLGEKGKFWLENHPAPEYGPVDEETEERALVAEKQKQLAEALKKYNSGYDNELYIRACYSLPARTQGEWSYVNACVSLSDAALSVCGAQHYGSLTFDQLTPEVIRFLAAFVLPQDEALELPF